MNIEESIKGSLQDLRTAYHEAGHAVVALVVGREVHRVSIVPNQTRLGACELKKGSSKQSRDSLEDEVLILLGGVAAEGRLTGVYDWCGGSRDLRQATYLIESRATTQKQADRLQKRMMDKVEYLLDDDVNWATVQAIAKQLLMTQSISGRNARHLFELEIQRAERA